jgi:hypothetical protein
MEPRIDLYSIFVISSEVVAREIEGELILVPLVGGIADLEEELFTMNKTGKAIWKRFNGKKTLKDIAKEISGEYDAPLSEIKKDVVGLVKELTKRKILVAVS